MFLKDKDKIALLSPAGLLSDEQPVINMQKLLQKWHLQSVIGTNALQRNGHYAGSDGERKNDLQTAMNQHDIKAIWALRGGYGSIRIVDELDFSKIKKQPKLLIGFSDITILHNKWHNEGLISLHAFMPVQLKDKIDKQVIEQTKNAIFGRDISYTFKANKNNCNITDVKAIVVGGNLANLYSVLGSSLDIDTQNKVLFIEDVGEQLYNIDRMMWGMKKAGKLSGLKALLVGKFTNIPKNNPYFGKNYKEIILEHVANYNYPVIFDAPIGHITQNYPLLLGAELQISFIDDKIVLKQKAVDNQHV